VLETLPEPRGAGVRRSWLVVGLRVALDGLAQPLPVQFRHHQVAHDEVRHLLARQFQRPRPVVSNPDTILAGQVFLQVPGLSAAT
jgi:hypothetical protein